MTCFVCGNDAPSIPCVGPCRDFWRDVIVRAALSPRANKGSRRVRVRHPVGYTGASNKAQLRARANGVCERCARRRAGLHVHRIVPGRFWGQYVTHNVRVLCPQCHVHEEHYCPSSVEQAVWIEAYCHIYPDASRLVQLDAA
jgi:hypothetical protein